MARPRTKRRSIVDIGRLAIRLYRQSVVRRAYVRGLSLREISAITGVSHTTVKRDLLAQGVPLREPALHHGHDPAPRRPKITPG